MQEIAKDSRLRLFVTVVTQRVPSALRCLVFGTLLSCCSVGVANDVSLLCGDQQAIDTRLSLVEQAASEICIISFTVDSSDTPLGLFAMLRQAAGRGVRVRMIFDGLNMRLPSGFAEHLADYGVEMRVYHPPLHGHPTRLNRRLHDKLFLVDRQAMVIGSRNLRDAHFGRGDKAFIDSDILLAGPICRQAANYFDQLWCSPNVLCVSKARSIGSDIKKDFKMGVMPFVATEPSRRQSYDQSMQTALRGITGGGREIECDQYCGESAPVVISGVSACLIHDADHRKSERTLQKHLCRMIDSAFVSIEIETPYPVFSHEILDALERARERGVSVTLLTNSLISTDQIIVYAGYQLDKRRLLRMGVRLFEYVGDGHLHVKTLLVDNHHVLLGSTNFDARGDLLNRELCVHISDPRVAQLLRPGMNQRMATAKRAELGRLFPKVIGEAPMHRHFQMRALQAVAPMVRQSL